MVSLPLALSPSSLFFPLFSLFFSLYSPTENNKFLCSAFAFMWLKIVDWQMQQYTSQWYWQHPAHVKRNELSYKDFSNSLDYLWMFILFLLLNFHWFNKKQWYLELKFREDLSRCWWYKIFAECPLCFISKNCFVNICYILYL